VDRSKAANGAKAHKTKKKFKFSSIYLTTLKIKKEKNLCYRN
jgi:hypothetical protein